MALKILHLTPHMGGGVGRVLKALTTLPVNASHTYRHEIACLDYANEGAVQWSAESGIPVHGDLAAKPAQLAEQILRADLLHVHWWNHPLIYEFLATRDWPPFRCALWAHVNGHAAPHLIPDAVLDYGDRFVLGTPYSLTAPSIQRRSTHWKEDRLRTVFASSGFDHVAGVRSEAHPGFRVGYVGTVDYCKMHPDYLRMHAETRLADATFVVCGGSREQQLRQEAHRLGVAEQFDIRGPVTDIRSVLASLDVFGYPLQPDHYGASEIALLEAMSVGIPPVVLNNGCESHIVRANQTGIIADTPQEYSAAVRYLYEHPAERKRLGTAARQQATDQFQGSRTVRDWHSIYTELADLPKRSRHGLIRGDSRATGWELYLTAMADSREAEWLRRAVLDPTEKELERLANLPAIFRGASNGSAFQYRRFFPGDAQLQRLCCLLERAERYQHAA